MRSVRIDFDFIYARLMASCGFRPEDIDEMTLFDIQVLFAYWAEFPPAHEILKYVHGIARAPVPKPGAITDDPSNISSLIARFPGGKVRAG